MWGLLLRGFPFLTGLGNLGKGALSFVKNHKLATILGAGTIGTLALSSRDKKEQSQGQEKEQAQELLQEQDKTQQKQTKQSKTKTKSKSGSSETINLPPLSSLFSQQGSNSLPQNNIPLQQDEEDLQQTYSSNVGGDKLSQIANQIQDLFVDLDKHRQMYEVLSQQYLQASEIYEKQLLQTMQSIPFLVAKTPLNNMTTEDLNEHLNNLFTSMPYTDAIEKVNQLTKGYYIAKMNGVDPKTLSTTDLVMIADNPALAKSVNDNIVQFLEQTGEILKYKIKSNMDKVGALKDQYQSILKELEEKGKLYKELIDAYKYEMGLDFNKYKFDTKLGFDEKKFNETMAQKKEEFNWKKYYQGEKLKLAEQNQKLKEEKSESVNKKGGIKEDLGD